ncbi:MAG: phosphotransferase [Gammaproteobacteria bacterium]|nr:phosphotransferase [Gammaproteobacteria bacterium]
MNIAHSNALGRIKALPCWSRPITIEPLVGGLTNLNFLVQHLSQKWVVRLAQDIPVHGISRQAELTALQAAVDLGFAPPLLYTENSIWVTRYIEGEVQTTSTLKNSNQLSRAAELIARVHHEMPLHLPLPHTLFWVFHVNRHYLRLLGSEELKRYEESNQFLEKKCTPRPLVFAHNDLLAANFIDDGKKLWLIDWEYSGFGDPLFDLAGLAANQDFSIQEQEALLEIYFRQNVDPTLKKQFALMKCAAALREMLWSMVSHQHLRVIGVNYPVYTEQNRVRFEQAYEELGNLR